VIHEADCFDIAERIGGERKGAARTLT
jgi:hypothetical protein